MEELIKLSQLLSYKCNYKRELPIGSDNKSKESKFIESLINNEYKSDHEAAQDLYQTSPKDVRYKMLKHRTKKKLYNNLLFLDSNKIGLKHHLRKEQECIMMLHQATVLKRQYELDLILNLANKVISISEDYDFTDHLVEAYELKLYCYSELGQLKEFESSLKHLQIHQQKLIQEKESLIKFQTLFVNLKQSVKKRQLYLSTYYNTLLELEEIWRTCRTYIAFNSFYRASILYYESIGDYKGIIRMTLDSESLIQQKSFNSTRFNSHFNKFILVYSHLRSRDYKEGLFFAAKYFDDFNFQTVNWFSYLENYFLLSLHSKNYSLSEVLLNKYNDNPFKNKISADAKERWKLYEFYLNLVSSDISPQNNPFLLHLPEYSKDKQGFNVAILILQFIYYLQKKESEALLYRIESLKKYILAHLKENFSLRSKLFLKLLILIVTEDYDAESSRKKGKKLFQKLADTPIPGDAFAEIEIVPYEHLWERILDTLQTHY